MTRREYLVSLSTPPRIHRTLLLHDADGPLTIRQIVHHWALVPEDEVRPEAEGRITLMLTVMAKHGIVNKVPAPWSDEDAWEALPLPEDTQERRRTWQRIDREWKRVRDRGSS